MTTKRMAAIALIFAAAGAGWMILGVTTAQRSMAAHGRLAQEVESLWGVPLVQQAPSFGVQIPGSDRSRWIMPTENKIAVDLDVDYRKKGLLWYPTYTCAFDGAYTIANLEKVAQKVRVHFDFPTLEGTYDAFSASIDGKPLAAPVNTHEGLGELIELGPGGSAVLRVTYKTRGIREWRYRTDPQVGRVQGLNLAINTNFNDVDYPDGCLSPMAAEETDDGMLLTWQANDLITREDIGVVIPEKLNPGPLTSRITFFAPVCLLFFFVLVATIDILYKLRIHPMHYLFVAAGFFAFHLLLAYMVGLINIHIAFIVSAVTAVSLVTFYLGAAFRGRFPAKAAVAGQLFFLVLFSYSFFFQGVTGLTVAIGSVATLAILMKVTAHLDWDEVFAPKPAPATPPPAPDIG